MATTLVACALRYDQAVVSHVGDSRCYLVRNGQARQITQDHTLVNEQRKMGLISAGEIAASDARHVLIRSLGPEMFVSPDTTALTLQPGDVLVLCTDGLHDEMSEAEIAAIASQKKDPPRSPANLWRAPSKSTAATTPRRRSFACARWSRSACTAAGPTGFPFEERRAPALIV